MRSNPESTKAQGGRHFLCWSLHQGNSYISLFRDSDQDNGILSNNFRHPEYTNKHAPFRN